VAGDVRHGSMKRVASSVGEGSICVSFVHQYLAKCVDGCLCDEVPYEYSIDGRTEADSAAVRGH
jgi:hypothetical protein